MEIERAEQTRKAGWMLFQQRRYLSQERDGRLPVGILACVHGKTQEQLDGDRIAAWHGIIVPIARALDQRFVVLGGREKPSSSRCAVRKDLENGRGYLFGGIQPAALESGLVQTQQRVANERVVLQASGEAGRAAARCPPQPQPARLVPECVDREQELGVLDGRVDRSEER